MGGVLTSADFGMAVKSDGMVRQETGPSRRLSNQEMKARGLERVRKLVFPPAPMGKSSAAVRLPGGVEMQVDLVDRVFVFPKGMTEREADDMAKGLIAAGFVDESYNKKKKAPEPTARRYAHPDNAPGEPVQGAVAYDLGKKQKGELELDEWGTVTTDDPAIQKHLEKSGWKSVTVPSGEAPEEGTDEDE